MTQPSQGRQMRKLSLLTELEISRVRVSTNRSRRWRWLLGWPLLPRCGVDFHGDRAAAKLPAGSFSKRFCLATRQPSLSQPTPLVPRGARETSRAGETRTAGGKDSVQMHP
jgi:hypothetical protein